MVDLIYFICSLVYYNLTAGPSSLPSFPSPLPWPAFLISSSLIHTSSVSFQKIHGILKNSFFSYHRTKVQVWNGEAIVFFWDVRIQLSCVWQDCSRAIEGTRETEQRLGCGDLHPKAAQNATFRFNLKKWEEEPWDCTFPLKRSRLSGSGFWRGICTSRKHVASPLGVSFFLHANED